jgi:hypothetical protein
VTGNHSGISSKFFNLSRIFQIMLSILLRMKFIFMVLLLLVCSGISAALFTKHFDNVAIDHLLEIVLFYRTSFLWNSKSLSISNISKARNFINHERIACLSYREYEVFRSIRFVSHRKILLMFSRAIYF